MRRRALLKGTAIPLTLSEDSYSAAPSSTTRYVYAYYGGQPITDLTTSMISNSNTSMMSFNVNSSGRITVYINSQNGRTSSRSGILTLTYQGQTVTYIVTQAADYEVSSTDERVTTASCVLDASPSSITGTGSFCPNETYIKCHVYFTGKQHTESVIRRTTTYASGYSWDYDVSGTEQSTTGASGSGSYDYDVKVNMSWIRNLTNIGDSTSAGYYYGIWACYPQNQQSIGLRIKYTGINSTYKLYRWYIDGKESVYKDFMVFINEDDCPA